EHRASARVPLQGFPSDRPAFSGCAQGRFARSSFPELPFKLINFLFRQKAPGAGTKFFVFERTDTHTMEFLNGMADGLKHPPDLLVAALMQCHFIPGILAAPEKPDGRRRQAFIVYIRSASKPFEIAFLRTTGNFHMIDLWYDSSFRHELREF